MLKPAYYLCSTIRNRLQDDSTFLCV